MVTSVLLWGSVVGLLHFVIVGAIYGNPIVDRWYKDAMASEPGVKRWDSQPRYLVTQFLGTQVEVFILTGVYFWLRPLLGPPGFGPSVLLALALSGVRVYPRFWNMWIQSTYPGRLLKTEFVAGVASTFAVVLLLEAFAGP